MNLVTIPEQVLYEQDNYKVVLSSYDADNVEHDAPYKVINKNTGIAEYYSRILPAALELMVAYEEGLANYEKHRRQEQIANSGHKIVEITKKPN